MVSFTLINTIHFKFYFVMNDWCSCWEGVSFESRAGQGMGCSERLRLNHWVWNVKSTFFFIINNSNRSVWNILKPRSKPNYSGCFLANPWPTVGGFGAARGPSVRAVSGVRVGLCGSLDTPSDCGCDFFFFFPCCVVVAKVEWWWWWWQWQWWL